MNLRLNIEQELQREHARFVSRRWFLSQCGLGLGSIALGSLLNSAHGAEAALRPAQSVNNPMAPKQPHFKPTAKRVIYLFMGGAPSQLDLFDYKPTLEKYNGQPVPPEVVKGQKYAFIKPDAALYASEFKFAKHGQCGAEISEAIPHLAEVVDDVAIVKSMYTDAFNHAPGQMMMQTGSPQFGRPCMGSWVL